MIPFERPDTVLASRAALLIVDVVASHVAGRLGRQIERRAAALARDRLERAKRAALTRLPRRPA